MPTVVVVSRRGLPILMLLVAAVHGGGTPVPVRSRVRTILFPASTCSRADFAPTELGRKATRIAQNAPAATEEPHVRQGK